MRRVSSFFTISITFLFLLGKLLALLFVRVHQGDAEGFENDSLDLQGVTGLSSPFIRNVTVTGPQKLGLLLGELEYNIDAAFS